MVVTVVIFALACAGMIASVLLKPHVAVGGHSVSLYWIPPFCGALIMWAGGLISTSALADGLFAQGEINPIKILVLFLSMTLISIYLDAAGFFRYLASAVLARAGKSRKALFYSLYLIVSVLTVFTSNDIIVLTFTPFICYFCKEAKLSPIPYLIAEFVAANTWSMIFLIGNPTNIYLAGSAGVTFFSYLKVMALPTVFAGLVSLGVMTLLFRRELKEPIEGEAQPATLANPFSVVLGLCHLGLCIICLVLSSVISLPMWLICLVFFVSLFAISFVRDLIGHKSMAILGESFRRAPWDIIPFILSMFVLVLTLTSSGATDEIGAYLVGQDAILRCGIGSFLSANVFNNIPMSVLFSSLIGTQAPLTALYATVIGSNLGAFFTPLGALAGIMWMGMLRVHGVSLSFGKFILYGATVAIPALAAALFGLFIVL